MSCSVGQVSRSMREMWDSDLGHRCLMLALWGGTAPLLPAQFLRAPGVHRDSR